MLDFHNVKRYKRFNLPEVDGDKYLRKDLEKYIIMRDNLINSKKIDVKKLEEQELNFLQDDYKFLWDFRGTGASKFMDLIKLYKVECKIAD
jgi:hypothetical protein